MGWSFNIRNWVFVYGMGVRLENGLFVYGLEC